MWYNFLEKTTLYVLKSSLKFWFKITGKDPDESIYETILELIEQKDADGKIIDSDERILLGNVLNLKDTPIDEIKIAKAEIVAIPHTTKINDILDLMLEKKMSQSIIYKKNIDDIIGYITLKDILQYYQNKKRKFDIEKFIHPIEFVSPSMRTLDLLLIMREKGQKMAIIVNEHGGVDGLVTFNNLIEEIIGDIQEVETINPPGKLIVKENGDIVVDGHTKLKEINEKLGINLQAEDPDEDILTIAGMVSGLAGRVPARGEIIQHESGMEFLILDANPRKIIRLCIKNLNQPYNISL